jgi:hypothetical protein
MLRVLGIILYVAIIGPIFLVSNVVAWVRHFRQPRGLALVAALLLAGCARSAPISANPVQTLSAPVAMQLPGMSQRIEEGLIEAAFNLDNAVKVGALDQNDPAPGCVHAVMKDLGLEPGTPPAESFAPKTDTLLGRGSVRYIELRQAQKLAGAGVTVDASCKALIGQIVIDVGRGGFKSQPGGGLLPSLR